MSDCWRIIKIIVQLAQIQLVAIHAVCAAWPEDVESGSSKCLYKGKVKANGQRPSSIESRFQKKVVGSGCFDAQPRELSGFNPSPFHPERCG